MYNAFQTIKGNINLSALTKEATLNVGQNSVFICRYLFYFIFNYKASSETRGKRGGGGARSRSSLRPSDLGERFRPRSSHKLPMPMLYAIQKRVIKLQKVQLTQRIDIEKKNRIYALKLCSRIRFSYKLITTLI